MLKFNRYLLLTGILLTTACTDPSAAAEDQNKMAEIIENDADSLILEALEDEKNLETVLSSLSQQGLITYISSEEVNIPLSLYNEYQNEKPQLVYTTLEDFRESAQDETYPFVLDGKEIVAYPTRMPLNQIPYEQGQYYVLVHSELEDQILDSVA